jgi:hypothetical protein
MATIARPKWTNRKLPPPRVEVSVFDADVALASDIVKDFK